MALTGIKTGKERFLIPDSLTHNAGTITATFGSTNYTVSVSTVTATTIYYLYLRNNAGTVTMYRDSTAPAAYRVLYPDALLVGAFLSDAAGSPVSEAS